MRGGVLFDGEIFWRQRCGGVSRYFCALAKALYQRGVAASVVAPLHRNALLAALPRNLVHGQRIEGPEFLAVKLAGTANSAWLQGAWQALLRPAVVHHTYYPPLNGRPPRRVPRVVTVHDMIPELMPHLVPGEERTVAAKRRAVEAADHVICVSEHTRADLLNLTNLSPNRVSVVYHGADDLPEPRAERLPDGLRPPFILYVGKRDGYKNFSTLAKAFAAAVNLPRETRLVAFGGGPFTRHEHEQFNRLGIAARVWQTSGDDHRLVHLLRTAFVMVYPSLYEGFGLPPLEALAQGCPVISSNAASMPEVLGDAALLFDPLSHEALTTHLERLALDESVRHQMIDRGHARARRFSWLSCAEQTAQIYESLTS